MDNRRLRLYQAFGFVIFFIFLTNMTLQFWSLGNNKPKTQTNSFFNKFLKTQYQENALISQQFTPFTIQADEKLSVCILIPTTSNAMQWDNIHETFLINLCMKSFNQTVELLKYNYFIYVGYDTGDPFFDNSTTNDALHNWQEQNIPTMTLRTLSFENPLKKPGPIMNNLSATAFNDGCEFMYRINDDTEFITPDWTSEFIRILKSFNPPFHGVVGPTCHQGNTAILTHDFVHRTHIEIFDSHYPKELTDWWLDDWITKVYGPQNTVKTENVTVIHHFMMTRYKVNMANFDSLNTIIANTQLQLTTKRNIQIIAYSLFNENPRYLEGAIANANLIHDTYPGWTMRVYHDNTVSIGFLKTLSDLKVDLVLVDENISKINKMSWRFLPAGDANITRFISRDIDSRLSMRERRAVDEWISSRLPFHVLRDHPSHTWYKISGGMWGSVGGALPKIRDELPQQQNPDEYMNDMNFLNNKIWPMMVEKGVLIHDSFSCNETNTRNFPMPRKGYEHIGSVFINGSMRQGDVNILENAIKRGEPICI